MIIEVVVAGNRVGFNERIAVKMYLTDWGSKKRVRGRHLKRTEVFLKH